MRALLKEQKAFDEVAWGNVCAEFATCVKRSPAFVPSLGACRAMVFPGASRRIAWSLCHAFVRISCEPTLGLQFEFALNSSHWARAKRSAYALGICHNCEK
jgi:hypothetical protein